jgi:hypothetical protein
MDVVKRALGFSIGLRKVSDWALWRSRSPSKRKERLLEACVPALYEHRPFPDSLSS